MTASILNQATQLQARFEQAKQHIDSLPLNQQASVAADLQEDIAVLFDLQQRVQSLFLTPNPAIGEDELLAISDKLSSAQVILESIDANNLTVAGIESLTTEIASLFLATKIDQTKAATLKKSVELLSQSNRFTNRETREAIQTLQATLAMATSPNPPQQTQPSQPRRNTPPSGGDQSIRPAQDEEFQASLFSDQYKEIVSKLVPNDFVKNFETVLLHFKTVRQYALGKANFVSQTAGRNILTHLDIVEDLLEKICSAQEQKEKTAAPPQVQVQARQSPREALNGLKTALTNLNNAPATASNQIQMITAVNIAFDTLTADEKAKLFAALNEVKQNSSPPIQTLPNAFASKSIQHWPGSAAFKLQAVEKILASSTPAPATPSTPPAAPVVKKAEEMRKRFNEVKNMMPTHSSQPAQTNRNNSSQLSGDFTAEELIFFSNMDIHSGVRPVQGAVSTHNVHPNISVILKLKNLLPLLQQGTTFQIEGAYKTLCTLGSEGLKSVFQMSGRDERSVGDRPFYHLYLIHKNESPEKLKADMEYGGKSFAGVYPATAEERTRAVQRTMVELALENIEDAINFENGELLVHSLDLLEEIKLDPKDRSNGIENAAHILFGQFYHRHREARSGNTSLANPDDGQFGGDFGRQGFRKINLTGVDPSIKLEIVNRLRTALKAVWKVE